MKTLIPPLCAQYMFAPEDALTDTQIEKILRQRERFYDANPEEKQSTNSGIACLSFLVGGQRYAVPLIAIVTVFAVHKLTPLPHTSAVIAGAIPFQGKPLIVLNIKHVFRQSSRGLADENHVIVLHGQHAPGLLVDRLDSVFVFHAAQQQPLSHSAALPNSTIAVAANDQNIVLLDTERLISLHPLNQQSY